jgi:hypothetical protein
MPNTSARSMPSASSRAAASAAICAQVYGAGVTLEAPLPRLSYAITRREPLNRSASGAQSLAIAGMPGTSSSAGPAPRST